MGISFLDSLYTVLSAHQGCCIIVMVELCNCFEGSRCFLEGGYRLVMWGFGITTSPPLTHSEGHVGSASGIALVRFWCYFHHFRYPGSPLMKSTDFQV